MCCPQTVLLDLWERISMRRVKICSKAAQGPVTKPLANHDAKTRTEPDMKHPSPYLYSNQAPDRVAPFEPVLEGRAINLREVIALISLHWKTVAAITFLVLLVGLNYVLARDRQFVANARILIDPAGIQVMDRDPLSRTGSNGASAAVVESQMRVMTSVSVLKQVIVKENLVADPEFLEGSSNIVFDAIGAIKAFLMPSQNLTDPQVKVLFNLKEAIRTSRPKNSYIVDLFVKTRYAKKSARLANVIAQTYIESEAVVRSGLARRASDTLTASLGDMRSELTAAENAVERYKADNNIVGSNLGLINEQELEQLNALLVEAGTRAALARSHLRQIEAARRSSADLNNIPEALSSPTISNLRISLTTALQNRSILSAGLLPSHPAMAAASAQIEVVRQQIAHELARIVGSAKVEADRTDNEQRQIEKRLDAIKQTTFVTNDSRVRLRELRRDAAAKRTVYESFLLRAKELGEQDGIDTTRARIISNALPPIRPSDLSSVLILAFALIVGFVSGILTVLFREIFFNTTDRPPVHFRTPLHQRQDTA